MAVTGISTRELPAYQKDLSIASLPSGREVFSYKRPIVLTFK